MFIMHSFWAIKYVNRVQVKTLLHTKRCPFYPLVFFFFLVFVFGVLFHISDVLVFMTLTKNAHWSIIITNIITETKCETWNFKCSFDEHSMNNLHLKKLHSFSLPFHLIQMRRTFSESNYAIVSLHSGNRIMELTISTSLTFGFWGKR